MSQHSFAETNDSEQNTDELFITIYGELRKLAASRLAAEASGQSLSPTALVHEVYLRLTGSRMSQGWNDRGHIFGAAAEAMRRILIDRARERQAKKRGGDARRVQLDPEAWCYTAAPDQLIALNESLERFAGDNLQAAELVKLRYFAGLSVEEAADVLQLSRASAYRLWTYAKAWLYRDMQKTA